MRGPWSRVILEVENAFGHDAGNRGGGHPPWTRRSRGSAPPSPTARRLPPGSGQRAPNGSWAGGPPRRRPGLHPGRRRTAAAVAAAVAAPDYLGPNSPVPRPVNEATPARREISASLGDAIGCIFDLTGDGPAGGLPPRLPSIWPTLRSPPRPRSPRGPRPDPPRRCSQSHRRRRPVIRRGTWDRA